LKIRLSVRKEFRATFIPVICLGKTAHGRTNISMKENNFEKRAFISNKLYRLFIALIVAFVIFMITKDKVTSIVSFMYTWIAFAVCYLIFSWQIIIACHPKDMKIVVKKADWGGYFVFLFVLLSAFIGLFAIFFLLKSIPDQSKGMLNLHILLAIVSVFCSWTLIHTLFTLKYAHEYYEASSQDDSNDDTYGEGLSFPEEKEPDYIDFAYFSFVIGMTFQVSDVQITSKHIRRVSLVHAFISFIYNTVIVALSINIVSGLISK
jgi:uncharacterized membrane protein